MSIPSDDDIRQLLGALDHGTADSVESETFDFKPWTGPKEDLKVAVEYAVCFANAEGGVVVFGVNDNVIGRAKAIHGVRNYDLDVWRRGIFDATRPNLAVEVSEIAVPEGSGTLLVVRVPAGGGTLYGTASGVFKRRIGKNCMPIDPAAFARQSVQTAAIDWSGATAEGVDLGDLDPVEIARGRQTAERLRSRSLAICVLGHRRQRRFLSVRDTARNGDIYSSRLWVNVN